MLIPNIKGLKFPDEAVTRFFFKETLSNINGKVIELGCGSGNNLRLFYEFGWDVTGVDTNLQCLTHANENLSSIKDEYGLKSDYCMVLDDMLHYLENHRGDFFDVVLFPSSLFYLSYDQITSVLYHLTKIVKPGSLLFFKLVTNLDYRSLNKNKERLGESTYRLKFRETDEFDCVVTYLSREKWASLIKGYFNFEYFNTLVLHFDHIQNGVNMRNDNIVFYGRLR